MGPTNYVKSLDGIRAIAILLVMAFHADLITFGWMGVQLFFVLSGYLIIGILWKEKMTPGSIFYKIKRFWVRRSLRIFPLYFGFLALLGITYLVFHFPASYGEYFPGLVTYTFNFGLYLPERDGPFFTFLWSLSVEEQFYLFFPLIVFFCSPRFIKYFMLAIIILCPVFRFLWGQYLISEHLVPNVVANRVYWNTLSHMDAFFLGGAISVFSLQVRIKRPRRLLFVSLLVALLCGLLNFLSVKPGNYFQDLGYGHGLINNYAYVWEYTCLNVLFAAFILALVSPYNSMRHFYLRKFLESKVMVSIGKVSYGMYIFHFGIILFFYAHFKALSGLGAKLLFFIPYVFCVYIVSAFSYRFFESYFIKLKDRFFQSPAKMPLPVNVIAGKES